MSENRHSMGKFVLCALSAALLWAVQPTESAAAPTRLAKVRTPVKEAKTPIARKPQIIEQGLRAANRSNNPYRESRETTRAKRVLISYAKRQAKSLGYTSKGQQAGVMLRVQVEVTSGPGTGKLQYQDIALSANGSMWRITQSTVKERKKWSLRKSTRVIQRRTQWKPSQAQYDHFSRAVTAAFETMSRPKGDAPKAIDINGIQIAE